MKTLQRTVNLRFFQDDAGSGWGVTHKETMDDNESRGFNSSWSGLMIFHDVFEHAHEFTDKYFQGDNALNVGGEMTAMGSCYYFYRSGLYQRLNDGGEWGMNGNTYVQTTKQFLDGACLSGYANYSNTLNCGVPKQKDTHDYDFESMLDEYCYQIEKLRKEHKLKKWGEYESNEGQEKDSAKQYLKSISFEKIRRLHRYGYYQAKKLVPRNDFNQDALSDFYNFWEKFCKLNDAEELNFQYRGIIFELYLDDETEEFTWKAEFEKHLDYLVDEENGPIEDLIFNNESARDYLEKIEETKKQKQLTTA